MKKILGRRNVNEKGRCVVDGRRNGKENGCGKDKERKNVSVTENEKEEKETKNEKENVNLLLDHVQGLVTERIVFVKEIGTETGSENGKGNEKGTERE